MRAVPRPLARPDPLECSRELAFSLHESGSAGVFLGDAMSRGKRTIAGILSLLAIVATTTTVNAAPAAPQGDTGTGTAVTPDGAPPAMAAPAPVRDDAHSAPAAAP